MKSIQNFVLIVAAAFGLAGCAGGGDNIMTPSATMPGVMDSPIGSTGSNGALTTVTIVAPRPLSQTPGLFSFSGLSLASPLAEPEALTPPSPNPNNFFAGMTDGMPHKLLLGSAPSPTPDDLCVYGSKQPRCFTDPPRQERRQYIGDPANPGHFREVRPGDEKIVENQIKTEKLIHQSLFWLEK